MATQDQRIADNSKRSVDASNRQSKAVPDATIAASRLDQRAWLGISNVRIVQFEKDKPFKINVDFKNTGKTPSLQTMVSIKWVQDFNIRPGPKDEWFNAIMEPAEAISPQGGTQYIWT